MSLSPALHWWVGGWDKTVLPACRFLQSSKTDLAYPRNGWIMQPPYPVWGYTSDSQSGSVWPPRDNWQYLETFLVISAEGVLGFPDSSVGKESACNAGDPGSIPGLGKSPGEGIGCPLQHSWASLVAQLVKNPPATWETWVQSLGWEDALKKGKATHSSVLAWRIQWIV